MASTLVLLSLILPAAAPPITAAAIASDGKSIVVGSQAGIEIRTWPGLKKDGTLETKLVNVHDLCFTSKGDELLAAGGTPRESGAVERWSWPQGALIERRELREDVLYSAAPAEAANGSYAAAAADGALVLVAGKERRSLSGHSRGVLDVAFLPGGERVISAGLDHTIRMWNAKSGEVERTLENHTALVRALAVRPHVEGLPVVASAGADKTVRLWQPTIGRLMRFARLPEEPLDIAWTPDGARLVASCIDGRLRVIDPDTVEILADLRGVAGWAYTLAVDAEGRAFVGGANGEMRVVELPR